MGKKFSALRAKMSAEAPHDANTLAETMLQKMQPHESPQIQGLSQYVMAKRLHVQQPATTMLEQRTDQTT
jgi:hypothetical protein